MSRQRRRSGARRRIEADAGRVVLVTTLKRRLRLTVATPERQFISANLTPEAARRIAARLTRVADTLARKRGER